MWKNVLNEVNKKLQSSNISLDVVKNDDGLYVVFIKFPNGTALCFDVTINENELYFVILGAAYHAYEYIINDGDEYISYRKIHGGTHDEPALIMSNSDSITLYFRKKETGEMIVVDNIDDFEDDYYNGCGEFYVRVEEYADACDAIDNVD